MLYARLKDMQRHISLCGIKTVAHVCYKHAAIAEWLTNPYFRQPRECTIVGMHYCTRDGLRRRQLSSTGDKDADKHLCKWEWKRTRALKEEIVSLLGPCTNTHTQTHTTGGVRSWTRAAVLRPELICRYGWISEEFYVWESTRTSDKGFCVNACSSSWTGKTSMGGCNRCNTSSIDFNLN